MNETERLLRDLHKKMDLIAETLKAYETETVVTVMRRAHVNDDGSETPVIDFYPAWNAAGTWGKYKIAHEYLNQPWQVERFEKFAGVRLDAIPLYAAAQALIRNPARPHKDEYPLAQPFLLWVRTPPGASDEERAKKQVLGYRRLPERGDARPAARPPAAEAPAPAAPPPAPPDATWDHWWREAGSAPDPLLFDTAVVRLEPWYTDSEKAAAFRVALFGTQYDPARAQTMAAAMLEYARQRQALNGTTDKKTAHDRAREAALAAANEAA